MKSEHGRRNCEKYSKVKYHENPSSGRRVVACGWTVTYRQTDGWADRQTDMENLIVIFRNLATARKKGHVSVRGHKGRYIQKASSNTDGIQLVRGQWEALRKTNSNISYILKVALQDAMLMQYDTVPSRTHICKCHHLLDFRSKVLIPVSENVKLVGNSQKYLGRKENLIFFFENYPFPQLCIFHI
jgi:hypothetical protein